MHDRSQQNKTLLNRQPSQLFHQSFLWKRWKSQGEKSTRKEWWWL